MCWLQGKVFRSVAISPLPIVPLQNNDHVVLATVKRPSSKLCDSNQKIFAIDKHVGCAIAGMTSDGISVVNVLRKHCLTNNFTYRSKLQLQRLSKEISNEWQRRSQRSGSRPPGVGLLLAGADAQGCHLIEISPCGNIYDHRAAAIGARSHSAQTYFEKFDHELESTTLEDMISIAVRGLRESCTEFTMDDCTVAVVGAHSEFRILDKGKLKNHLEI